MTTTTWAIVLASGKDEMLNSETCTAFLNVNNRPVLSYSLIAFEKCPDVDGVIVVAPKDRLEQVVSVVQMYGCHKVRKVVPGASTEYSSFQNCLKYADDDAGLFVLHEASRPGLSAGDASALVKAGKKHGVVMAGQVVKDGTALVSKSGGIEDYPEAGSVWRYSMPLALKRDVLEKAVSVIKRKKKNPKSLEEALDLAGQEFRLAAFEHFPQKIGDARDIDAVGHALATA
jgi:2-C-methyl-D-erythritol 4-phosphate cytidylyltransferase